MALHLTQAERLQAEAYRAMIRRARQRLAVAPFARINPARDRQIDRSHKAAVSRLFCVATAVRYGVERPGVHVAHVRFSNAAYAIKNPGMQRKPDDRWTLPLCPEEHRLQHSMGETEYWAELKVDPHMLAKGLWLASPDEDYMLAVLRQAVTGRHSSDHRMPKLVQSR